MAKKKTKPGRCVHCLRITGVTEDDHVFPDSWYPDSTPTTVQRWTAPSCPRCNREHGRLENDLFIRLSMCVDSKKMAAAGLAAKAMRAMGFDTEGLSESEQRHREAVRQKIKSEIVSRESLAGKPGKIPGLGPPDDTESQWSIPLQFAAFAIIVEKTVRGCEWRLRRRYIEEPYGVRISPDSGLNYPSVFEPWIKDIDLGPGCKIKYVCVTENPNVSRYWIAIWDTMYFHIVVDFEEYLKQVDLQSHKLEGIDPAEFPSGMRLSRYLRAYEE